MRTINIFSSVDDVQFENQSEVKFGTMLVSTGAKVLTKANPVALCIDAGLALIDVATSYFNYAKEREITKQLRMENELIRKELEAQLTLLKLENIREKVRREKRIEQLSRQLKIVSANNRNLIKSIDSNLSVAKRMLQIVKEERENQVNFEKIQVLQIELDKFIRASLMCLMYAADDTGKVEE